MFKFLDLKTEMFAVDISDCAIKVLKLKKKHNFFKVEFLNEIEIQPGVVDGGVIKNEEVLTGLIKKSLTTLPGKKIRLKDVIISLPEEKSFLEVIQMPQMSREELKTAVLYQAENYIPLPIDQVYLDFKIIDTNLQNNDHLDVLLIAMPKIIIDSYLLCFKKADLNPVVLEVESQAIVRALVKNESSTTPLILVNYGKKNSNIIIFSGKSIKFTSSVTASSNQITEAIAKALNISEEQAEKIKLNYSLLKKDENEESKKIYNIIYPVLTELVVQIKKYLTFYNDHNFHEHNNDLVDNKSNGKIILSGGGSNLKGLAEFISKEILIKTEIGDVFSNLNLKENNFFPISKEKKSSFCTVIGLAIRGAEKYD